MLILQWWIYYIITTKRLTSDAFVLDFVQVLQKQKNPVGRPVKKIKITDIIVIAAPPLTTTIPSIITLDYNG